MKYHYTFTFDKTARNGLICAELRIYEKDRYFGESKGSSLGSELLCIGMQKNSEKTEYSSIGWYGFHVAGLALGRGSTGEAVKLITAIYKSMGKHGNSLKSILKVLVKAERVVHSKWVDKNTSYGFDSGKDYWVPKKVSKKHAAYHEAQVAGFIAW